LLPLTSGPIYLVGGSVRDLLLGKQDIKDIDLLMPTGSEGVARAFSSAIKGSFFFLDETRKISRVVKALDTNSVQFDFTNYEGPDLSDDLGRRDFTINAMALDLREFLRTRSLDSLTDLFQGRQDIQNGLVRVTRPEVLDDDPLRLLRAVRFAATLGFSIEEETASQIRARAMRIAEPALERIRDELFLILSEKDAEKHLLLLESLGMLAPLFPELMPLRGFAPGFYHTHDVLAHSIKTAGYLDRVLDDLPAISPGYADAVLSHLEQELEHLVTRKAALRFACLLHDNAKPETFSDADGRIRFHDHDKRGAEKAALICRRFRLSKDTEKAVTKVIRQHMRLFNLSTPGGPSKNAIHRYCRDMGDSLPESLLLAQADARATSEIMPKEKFTDTKGPMAAVLEYYYSKFLKAEAAPLVTGNDLIEQGLKPGPEFRKILEEVKEKQAEGTLRDRDEALAYVEKMK